MKQRDARLESVGMRGNEYVWLRGFGGVRLGKTGAPVWPARVLRGLADVEPASKDKVLKAKKPDRFLVFTYGDKAYVWAKEEQLVGMEGETDALARAAKNSLIHAALRAVIDERSAAATKKQKPSPVSTPRTTTTTTTTAAAATAPSPSRPSAVVVDEEDGLSAYEKQRLENMRANQRALEALGIVPASASLGFSTPPKREVDPAEKARRMQERHERMLEAQANRRHSSRLDGESAGRATKRYADELERYDELERAEAAARVLQRKRQRAAGYGGSGRGGGSKAAADALLSEEERAAIAAAYDEASGWLDDMRRYFTDKLSEPNLRNVMKQVTALATGQGVPHTLKPTYFRKGEPVTLDEDMIALRVSANQFLRPEDDPGHGWRLDHPIGKLGLFQTFLHAKQRQQRGQH